MGKDLIVDGKIAKMSIKIKCLVEIVKKGAYNKYMKSNRKAKEF